MKSDTLCIVGCGKSKIWDKNPDICPVKARDIYTGTFSKKCIEYAEKFHPNSWRILSAKYGFMRGDEIIIKPYNACFHHLNSISVYELKNQIDENGLNEYDKIIVLGGKYYTELIKLIFPFKQIFNPLEGCRGIGYMIKSLNMAINR